MNNLEDLSPRRLAWLRFRRHRLAMLGGGILVFLYVLAIFCEVISPYTPEQRNARAINAPPMSVRFFDAEGSFHLRPFVYAYDLSINADTWMREYQENLNIRYNLHFFVRGEPYKLWGLIQTDRHLVGVASDGDGYFHWLGTDSLGRDVFSRILYGSRVSLSIGIIGVALTLFLGVLLGGFAGYLGGLIDNVVQRSIEVLQSIPTLPLWMGLSAALPATWSPIATYFGVTIILSLFGWTMLARQVRGRFLAMREEDFVVAARLMGASDTRIVFRHMLPSFTSHIITTATLAVPAMILGETALSFLGIGLRPPVVSWGVLLQQAQNYQVIVMTPWLLLPGAFIVVTVIAFNFLGDGLRDAADPYGSGKAA
ncbi:MAG: ABC transporter permease [bacterium]